MDACVDPTKIPYPRSDYGVDGPCADAVYGSVKDSDCDDSDDPKTTGGETYRVDGMYLSHDRNEAYDTHCERCKAPNEHDLLVPVAVEVRAFLEY